jgi:MFS family permease
VTFPYTGHGRDAEAASRPPLHWAAALHALRDVRHNRPVLAMVVVGGASSLLIGNAFVALMPGFAADLGGDGGGLGYSVLLGANAAGAFFGGLLLEGTGWLRPRVRTAIVTTAVWCLFMLGFAAAQSYPLAVVLMFAAGATNLAFFSMAQTLVQLLAAPVDRGRMVGLFNMAALGLRVGSGVTVGVLGSVIGIHWALGLSAAALFAVMLVLLAYAGGGTPPERAPPLQPSTPSLAILSPSGGGSGWGRPSSTQHPVLSTQYSPVPGTGEG